MHIHRRRTLQLLAAAPLIARAARADQTVRIGYQKYGLLLVLKARGTLEKALQARVSHVLDGAGRMRVETGADQEALAREQIQLTEEPRGAAADDRRHRAPRPRSSARFSSATN